MVVKEKSNWFRMLFVWHGSVLPEILPRLVALLLLSSCIVYFRGQFFHYKIPLNPTPFTLIGIALAIFLGFRNSASYDRFWEGRKLWGALLIDSRSLVRQALTLPNVPATPEGMAYFTHLLIAMAYSLKHQLRRTPATPDLERLLPPALAQTLLQELAHWVQQRKSEGHLDSVTQAAFDHNLNQLSYVIGGCERIAGTPIPYTYNVMLHRTVYIYCFLLPFGLVDSIGWMTPIMTVFTGYTFIALDALVTELEEPFGEEPNDLPLNTICQTIEISLLEMIGQEAPVFPEREKAYLFN